MDDHDATTQRPNGRPNPELSVTVTRSAGTDGAVVVFIDTTFEPDASDGGPGLRVMVNDAVVLAGRSYEHCDGEREAVAVRLDTTVAELAHSA